MLLILHPVDLYAHHGSSFLYTDCDCSLHASRKILDDFADINVQRIPLFPTALVMIRRQLEVLAWTVEVPGLEGVRSCTQSRLVEIRRASLAELVVAAIDTHDKEGMSRAAARLGKNAGNGVFKVLTGAEARQVAHGMLEAEHGRQVEVAREHVCLDESTGGIAPTVQGNGAHKGTNKLCVSCVGGRLCDTPLSTRSDHDVAKLVVVKDAGGEAVALPLGTYLLEARRSVARIDLDILEQAGIDLAARGGGRLDTPFLGDACEGGGRCVGGNARVENGQRQARILDQEILGHVEGDDAVTDKGERDIIKVWIAVGAPADEGPGQSRHGQRGGELETGVKSVQLGREHCSRGRRRRRICEEIATILLGRNV